MTERSRTAEAKARVYLDMPREKVWELLKDLSMAHRYVPGVVDTRITTEQKEGVGASRKVYQSETSAIDETVEEWNEGRGFLIRLHRGNAGPPFPFKQAWFRYAISDCGAGTEVATSLIYVMRFGLPGRLLERAFLRFFIRSRIRAVALGLKTCYENITN